MKSKLKKIYAVSTAAITAFSVCCIPAVSESITTSLSASAAEESSELTDANTGLKYIVENGTATITGCDPTLINVNIPANINGNPVKTIGESAFSSNNKLEKITIAEGITTIDDNAFSYSRFITSVDLPSTVTYIGNGAFDVCTRLSDVEIPSGVTVINYRTFRCCALKQVVIPEGVTEIRESAFESNNELLEVDIPSTVSVIGSKAFDGCQMLQYLIVPYGVVSIGDNAFHGCNNMSFVALPESLLYIGKESFDYCRALKKITLPASLISIGDAAFYDTSITEFEIPDSVIYVGTYAYPKNAVTELVDGVDYIGKWAVNHKNVNDFKIREGTVGIAESTFSYASCKEIEFPSTLKYICPTAFYKSKIDNFTVSEDNPYLCAADSVIYSKDMTEIILYPDCKSNESFDIPNTVCMIDDYAFYNCSLLKSVTVPESVWYVGDYSFAYCSGITEINLPEGVERIGDFAFYECSGLESFDIPDSVISVGASAFSGYPVCVDRYGHVMVDDWIIYGDDFYSEIEINEAVRGIADNAFNNCSITDVTFPSSVEYIGDSAFENCKELKNVTMSEGLVSIDDYAFFGCKKLNTPEIPDSVIRIGTLAFKDCFNAVKNFDGIGYVDSWAVDADYSIDKAVLQNGTRGIGEMAFYGCIDLKSAVLPDTLCFINQSAFEYCLSLEDITLPESLLLINNRAFSECEKLSKISFLNPETLISLNSLTIDENAVIYGYKGSSAEEYAITFERKFEALDDVGTKITGDVNSDGTFDISDAVMLKNYIVNAGSLTDWTVGDLSEDGIIDIFDLALMKNLLIS